jgi:prepilin-type N-terminal cleavage/methylation domain-containing protein
VRAGFSLVEMTIALAIVLVVTGAIFAVMNPAHGAFHSQPEVIDMQQRLRVSVDAIANDLMMAGAGTVTYFPAVLPIRRGLIAGDSAAAYFDDRVSLLYAQPGGGETTLTMPTDAGTMLYVTSANGFAPNVLAVVFDETGAYDTFRVTAIQDAPPALVHAGGALSKTYAAGASVARIVSATYWMRADTTSGASELMRYDGWQSDVPVADDVIGLAFEYFGDPSPPILRKALSEPEGPWTSYGPKPPEIDVDDAATTVYGSGENCTFAVIDGATASRPEMIHLGSSSLVTLTASQLTDGPWCPDPADPRRYDADLLRIRRVRVTLRVRASRTFFHPLPDRQSIFDVTPRNLSLPQ